MQSQTGAIHFRELRKCNDIVSALTAFAKAMGELSGVQQVAIYLFDYTNTRLLLFAEWTEETGSIQRNHEFIPLTDEKHPLIYALRCGEIYTADIVAVLQNHSTVSHHSFTPLTSGTLIASPMPIPSQTSIGGILLYAKKKELLLSNESIMLRDYATLLIQNILVSRKNKDDLHQRIKSDIPRTDVFEKENKKIISTELLGRSDAMNDIRQKIAKIASTDIPVLITGETGTGKEVVASAIHKTSSRRMYPFIKINCAALPEHLIESELFGHVKGAFTGANQAYIGLMREADKGTLFLDEIGDMPLILQAKLLRVLEDSEIRPVGDTSPKKIDIRIVSATNRNLLEYANEGKFRLDLYYRLVGMHIHIPPLRERREDISDFAMHFLNMHIKKQNRHGVFLSANTLEYLRQGDYYGNARELSACIQNMLLLTEPYVKEINFDSFHNANALPLENLMEKVLNYENTLILEALEKHNYNISHTAKALNIPRSTLNSKLKKNDSLFFEILSENSKG